MNSICLCHGCPILRIVKDDRLHNRMIRLRLKGIPMENDMLTPVFVLVDEHLALQSVEANGETEEEKAQRTHLAEILGDIAKTARKAQLKSCS